MNNLSDLGSALRTARLEAKRSQRDIARAAGLTQATVDRLEHNAIDPRYSTIRRILKELGHELIVVPRSSLSIVSDVLRPSEDRPLIDIDGSDDDDDQ
jgi:transcriptional regulator with XRE-family HTH domain